MKPRNRVVFVLWALIGISIFILWNLAKPKTDKKIVPAPIAAQPAIVPESSPPPSPQVSSTPPAPPQTAPDTPTPVHNGAGIYPGFGPQDVVPAADPQADLKTALPDIAQLYRAGAMIAYSETYIPPDDFAKMSPEERQRQQASFVGMTQNPQMQKVFDDIAQVYDSLANQTPTFNAAGNEATYTYTQPNGNPASIVFVKINGKWYKKPVDPGN